MTTSGVAGGGNLDDATVRGFGAEWARFDHADVPEDELRREFDVYFRLVDDALLDGADVLDVGCGTGRWARFVAPLARRLVLVDAAEDALDVARRTLSAHPACEFHLASVDDLPVPDGSMDLVYSLGVLHHLPDPEAGLRACARAVRPGGHLLVYLYYRFDMRPAWFRAVWRASDVLRRGVSRLPFPLRRAVADGLALTVYWPLSRLARLVRWTGGDPSGLPLSAYADRSFYWLRTDALDRFGTRLEHRFTRPEIEGMLGRAGLVDVRFVEDGAFWTALARRPVA